MRNLRDVYSRTPFTGFGWREVFVVDTGTDQPVGSCCRKQWPVGLNLFVLSVTASLVVAFETSASAALLGGVSCLLTGVSCECGGCELFFLGQQRRGARVGVLDWERCR